MDTTDIDAAAARLQGDQTVYAGNSDLYYSDLFTLKNYAIARLADDKRREEDRALPVTMKEAVEAFATSEHIVCTEGKDILIEMDHVFIPIQTRGQLLDLLSALGIKPKETTHA